MGKPNKQSAGLLMFRQTEGRIDVLLVHPGGPYWVNKDQGVWTIPKGEYDDSEEPLRAARREFTEETGFASHEPFLPLGSVRQKSGKNVTAWAFEGDCDPAYLVSNTCDIEWPPRSGRSVTIPEVDRGKWFTSEEAFNCIREEQRPLLDRLHQLIREW